MISSASPVLNLYKVIFEKYSLNKHRKVEYVG